MRNTGTARSTKIENLLAGLDEDAVETAEDTSRELAPEGVPHTVLDLGPVNAPVNRYPLLAVDRLPRDQVFRDQQALLALRDEDTGMPVGLENHVRAAPRPSPSSAATSPSTTASAPSATARCAALRNTSASTSESACERPFRNVSVSKHSDTYHGHLLLRVQEDRPVP